MSIVTGTAVAVEHLGVSAPAALMGSRIRFTYPSAATHSTVFVSGKLEKISRPVAAVDDHPPVLLRVDRLWHAVPAGTLVTIETGELR